MANKTEKIEIRVTADFKKRLKSRADEAGLSLSDYVVKALENNRITILKEGSEIAKQLMQLRMSFDKKGLQANFSGIIRELVLKIDGLIENFPQNRTKDELDETNIIDCTEFDTEDNWDEDGDII